MSSIEGRVGHAREPRIALNSGLCLDVAAKARAAEAARWAYPAGGRSLGKMMPLHLDEHGAPHEVGVKTDAEELLREIDRERAGEACVGPARVVRLSALSSRLAVATPT